MRNNTDIVLKVKDHRTIATNPDVFWIPIDENAPFGAECFLINEEAKSAWRGKLTKGDRFATHYYPFPVFSD